MRVAFRVDASRRIGTGHVVRCLTLAEALREQGAEILFVHRAHAENMTAAIRARGYVVRELPAPEVEAGAGDEANYAHWLGVPVEQDARETREALGEEQPDWLVVDHYALDATWEVELRPIVGSIAVLDDLAERSHDCDLLLDQNYFRQPEARYTGLVPEHAIRLCGPRYALLRAEYSRARRIIGPRRGPVSRLLVFYGGGDPDNETGRAMRVLARPAFAHVAVDVVIGGSHPYQEDLRRQAAERPWTTVHGPREHLVDLQIEADLALGGGGTTTWERCALGLPSIVTAVAENQESFNQALADDGVIRYLGHRRTVTDDGLAEALQAAFDDPETLATEAARAWRVTDGLGTWRLAEAMHPTNGTQLALRHATRADKALYFEWANDPEARRQAHNPDPIPWSDHDAWFDRKLADSAVRLWVLETPAGLPVGQVRVELEGDEAILSYSIDTSFRGRGWGPRLLELAADVWRANGENANLIGETVAGNEASRRAFLRAGFQEETGGYRYRLGCDSTRAAESTTGRGGC